MVSPFGGVIGSYEAAQNLQMKRQAQQDAQDAQDAAQEAQKAAVEYQQGQDLLRQQNLDRAFKAQQDQQGVENAATQAKFDMDKDFHKQTADYHNQLIQNAITKMGQTTDKATADRLQKHYQFLLSQGMAPVDAYTQALVAMHLPGNENGPGMPAQGQPGALGQAGMGILGVPQPGQGHPQPNPPSVIPPAAPSGVGGVPNPLQTPQIAAPSPLQHDIFESLNQAGAMRRGEVPSGGLSPVPLPVQAGKMAQTDARTAEINQRSDFTKAKTDEINLLAPLKAGNIRSIMDFRKWSQTERGIMDKSLRDYRQDSLNLRSAAQKFSQARATAKDAKELQPDRDDLQQTYATLSKGYQAADLHILSLQKERDGLMGLYNAIRPTAKDPQGQAAWDALHAVAYPADPAHNRPAQTMGDARLEDINNSLDTLSQQHTVNKRSLDYYGKMLEGIRIDDTGAKQTGDAAGKSFQSQWGPPPPAEPAPAGQQWTLTGQGDNQEYKLKPVASVTISPSAKGLAKPTGGPLPGLGGPGYTPPPRKTTVPPNIKLKSTGGGVVYQAPGITVKKH